MSKQQKKNAMKKYVGKKYKIEALEPRLLMDASTAYSVSDWTNELDCLSSAPLWSSSTLQSNANVNQFITALYVKNDKTSTNERAKISDLVQFDNTYYGEYGLDSSKVIIDAIKSDIQKKLPTDGKKISAAELQEKVKNGALHPELKYFKADITYEANLNSNGEIVFDASCSFTRLNADYPVAWSSNYSSQLDRYNKKDTDIKKAKDLFTADLSSTNVEIESDFDFSEYSKKLEFTFVLDGRADNKVDLESVATISTKFKEDSTPDFEAKYGVLGLSETETDKSLVNIVSKWTISSKWDESIGDLITENEVDDGLGVKLSYKIKNIGDTFVSGVANHEYKYERALSFDENSKGNWNHTSIERFNTFSMGKILEKLQGISSKLSAIQSGDYYDNNVDFSGCLAKNAHNLLNLSDLLSNIINEPPATLQELVTRLKNNKYWNDSASQDKRITVDTKGISIPVELVISKGDSSVALSKEWLENFFNVEVLEIPSVTVSSRATLSFQLLVPFVESEKAKSTSELDKLGLGQYDEQLGSIIGANAIVAEKMDHYYGGRSDLSTYADYVKGQCGNRFTSCVNADTCSYVLYSASSSAVQLDLSKYPEFDGVTPNYGFVIKWNASADKAEIDYKYLDQKTKNFVANDIEGLASLLTSVLGRSKNDDVKNVKVVALNNEYLAVLIDSNEESVIQSIGEDFNEHLKVSLLQDSKKIEGWIISDIFTKDNVKTIWVSNELPPERYNNSAKMTVTVGNESCEIEFAPGYFNSASSVGDIASCLQEMINSKFRWEIEDAEKGIVYEPARLMVESFNGQIRFVSLQDYSIDFYDKEFAEWLGFTTYSSFADKRWIEHVVIATSHDETKKVQMDEKIASAKFGTKVGEKDLWADVPSSFELIFEVDGKKKTIKLEKSDFESKKWASDAAKILQDALNEGFEWSADNVGLYVISHNDKISFKSSKEFVVGCTDESVLNWLGFYSFSQNKEGEKTVYEILKYKEIYSDKVDITYFQNIDADESPKVYVDILFDDDDRLNVNFDSAEMVELKSLHALAKYMNARIKESHEEGFDVPDVEVSVKDGRLCFRSVENFTIYFGNIADAELLGFYPVVEKVDASGLFKVSTPSESIEYKDVLKTSAIEVCVNVHEESKEHQEKYELDLSSIVDACQKKNAAVKDCTVDEILQEIVLKLNKAICEKNGDKEYVKYFVVDGLKIVAAKEYEIKYRIQKISDINGFTIASMLGLCGEYGSDPEKERDEFFVDANLIDDAIEDDAMVPLFQNFNLTIANVIVNGNINIAARYGVFGERIKGNITGLNCVTTIGADKTKTRLKGIKEPTYNYGFLAGFGTPKFEVEVDPTLDGVDVAFSAEAAIRENDMVWKPNKKLVDKESLNTAECAFHHKTYSMAHLYDDFSSKMCAKWDSYYFGENAKSSLDKIQLPILGKSILEIMGLRNKFEELNNYFERIQSGSNIQEILDYIKKETGMEVTASYEYSTRNNVKDTILHLTFKWTKGISNYLLELDSLNLGREDFRLNSQLRTYIDATISFTGQVNIHAADGLIRFSVHSPQLNGSISVKALRISADMEINAVENVDGKDVLKQAEFQVESQSGKESSISLNAVINGNSLNLNLNGSLYVYKYGAEAGLITLNCNSNINSTPQTKVLCKDATGQVKTYGGIQEGPLTLDLSNVKNLELKQTNLFDKFRNSVDGLSNTVRRLQGSLNSALVKGNIRHIPLVGDSIVNVGDSLSFLNTNFIEPLRKYVYKKTDGMNAYAVTEKLYTILCDYIATGTDALEVCGDGKSTWWAKKEFNRYYHGIQFYESEDEAYWHLRLSVNYTLDKNADFDLGFPGLGLRAEGGVALELQLILDIGFGISKKEGAFILLSNGYDKKDDPETDYSDVEQRVKGESVGTAHIGDDLKIMLTVKPSASIEGSLGFLAMSAKVDAGQVKPIILGIDLNDGDKSDKVALNDWENDKKAKTTIRMNELLSGISTQANLRGQIDLDVPMTLGIGGYSKSAPHIDTSLSVGWASDFGKGMGDLKAVAFNDIVFDCGSFVKNTIGSVIQKINKVIDPVRPLIKFLQTEIPVLNKLPAGKVRITILDLVKKFGNKKKMNFGFLDDIIEIDNMVGKLKEYTNKGIYIGSWDVVKAGTEMDETLRQAGQDFIDGKISDAEKFVSEKLSKLNLKKSFVDLQNAVDTVSSIAGNVDSYVDYAKEAISDKIEDVQKAAEKWKLPASGAGASSTEIQKPEFGGNWIFPIIDNPETEIMKILVGGHADLVVFDMKPLKFSFDWSKSFPIIGPLCADVGFSFGVDIDLCFGYDTYGIERWAQSNFKNVAALIDGFYVADWDPISGDDITEIVFHSGVVAGASLGGRFGVNVGLNLNVNLDLKDPNDDGKVRLTEMAEMLSLNPLDTFDVSASISARAFAYLDVFFYRKEWTLWSSGAFDLFNTASKQNDNLATRSGDSLVVNVGEFAKENSVAELSEDGADDVEVIVTGSNKAKITFNKNGKNREYKVNEENLCIYAGEDNDKIKISSEVKAEFNIFVYGGNGDDLIDLSGLELAEGYVAVVVGSSGADVIKGASSGTNYLFGDEGDVKFTPDSKGKKKKTLQYAIAYPSDNASGGTDVILGASIKDEKKPQPKNYIFGGAGNDFIVGGSGENTIFGDYGRLSRDSRGFDVADHHDSFDDGGDDLVYGGGAIDHIYGGAGNDFIHANGDDDEIYGGQGNDVIYGGSGDDIVYGGDGTDVIFGDMPFKSDLVIARSDNGRGSMLPYGFVPHDLKGMMDASGKYISPFFTAADGNNFKADTIGVFDFVKKFVSKNASVLPSIEKVLDGVDSWEKLDSKKYGENSTNKGSDVIDGGNGADVIFGDDGRNATDKVQTAFIGGNDVITGGAGNDFIDGDAGSDTINGGSGMDIVYGGRGNDTLDGGSGKDFVFGDDGLADYESESPKDGQWFNKNGIVANGEAVFGEIMDSVGRTFGISNEAKSKKDGGDDIIVAGNDSDFVDGQSGNDTYRIQFMGGPSEVFTNVMDSGNDTNDSMKALGTLDGDNILIRSSDKGLGMIGMMPEDNGKGSVERVNYWYAGENRGVENISVETGLGNDVVTVSSTLSSMSIDAGGGNDEINIGRLYKNGLPKVNALDSFNDSVIKTSEGLLDSGNTHALFVEGGAGTDVFEILHSNSALSLHGGLEGVTYNIRNFVDENGDFIVNKGLISLTGKGNEYAREIKSEYICRMATLNYYATTLEDVVYSCDSILSSCCELQTIGIDEFHFFGGEGTNHYYVMGSEKLFYNKMFVDLEAGENVLYVGSDLTESQYRTQIEKLRKNRAKTIELITDGLDNIPIMSEGETFEYGIKLSQKPQGKVSVKISVPLTSDLEERNKNSGILLVDEKGNYCSSIVKEFDSNNYNSIQKIKIVYVGDNYVDDNDVAFLLQDIETSSPADKVDFMMNIPILLSDESSGDIWAFNSPMCDKLGFDVVNSGVILCDRPEIDLTKLSLASLRFTNEAGDVSYISTSKTSGSDYWYKAEKNKIYIYSASTDELVPITGRLDYVNMLKHYSQNPAYYGLDNCFILNSSTFQLAYAHGSIEYGISYSTNCLQLVVGEDRYDLSETPSTTGYYVKVSGNQFVIYSGETGLPVEVTGFLHFAASPDGVAAKEYISKLCNTEIGGSISKIIYQNGLLFTRVGDVRSYEAIESGIDAYSPENGIAQIDLWRASSSATTPAPAPAAAPAASATVSFGAAEVRSDVVLEDGMPDFVSVAEGETIRFKISAPKSANPSVAMMVNSEDGKSLPALTWSWDDSSKKRRSVEEDADLAYQVNLSDVASEDDFIYVYLHAAKACQFVASAFVG